MSENGTGVQYPTIELGGQTYTVKFSRAMLYRLGKAGVKFSPQFKAPEGDKPGGIQMDFAQVVDVLHLAIGFQGTHDDLAELVFDKRNEAVSAIMLAWGKAFPSPQIQLREPAGANPEAPAN